MTAVMDARLASLESELASVKAKADADAIDHEHVQQNMHARYAALESEHTAAVVERDALKGQLAAARDELAAAKAKLKKNEDFFDGMKAKLEAQEREESAATAIQARARGRQTRGAAKASA